MKRIHSLIQLNAGLESKVEDADAEVVSQPIEGQPYSKPTSEVLLAQHRAQVAAAKADERIPADGSLPAGQSAVSQESGVTTTDDGDIPATRGDVAGDEHRRADLPRARPGVPAELAPESEQRTPGSVQTTTVPKDGNNVGEPDKTGEAKSNIPVTTGTGTGTAYNGDAYPRNTTSTQNSAVSTEALTPEELAQVAQIAAAAGAAAAGAGGQSPESVEEPTAANAAIEAAEAIAGTPEGTTPPGPNAGSAAATPAEAAKVVADLIQANPDTVSQIAAAIDRVADAAMAATGQRPTEIAAAAEANAGTANVGEISEEFEEAEEEAEEAEDDLDEIEDIEDDLNTATESLLDSRELLFSLEGVVESALQNGGLSDDAAQILQTVADGIAEQEDIDDVDLGLESLAYRDRVVASDYALSRLRYAREQLDYELTVSQEGLFDVFRGYTAKTESWVNATRTAISEAKKAIDPAGETTITVTGVSGSLKERSAYTRKVLGVILGEYYDGLKRGAVQLTSLYRKLEDGNRDYDTVSNQIRSLSLAAPSVLSETVRKPLDGRASNDLVGGKRLVLALDGRNSSTEIIKAEAKHEVKVKGTELQAVLDDVDATLALILDMMRDYKVVTKDINREDTRGVGASTNAKAYMIAASIFSVPLLSLLSADVRRVFYRTFTAGRDAKKNVAAEYAAGLMLTRNAIKVARNYAESVIAIAKKMA